MYIVEAGSDFGLSLAILSLLKIELILIFKEPGFQNRDLEQNYCSRSKNSGEVREREIKEIVRVFNSKSLKLLRYNYKI